MCIYMYIYTKALQSPFKDLPEPPKPLQSAPIQGVQGKGWHRTRRPRGTRIVMGVLCNRPEVFYPDRVLRAPRGLQKSLKGPAN